MYAQMQGDPKYMIISASFFQWEDCPSVKGFWKTQIGNFLKCNGIINYLRSCTIMFKSTYHHVNFRNIIPTPSHSMKLFTARTSITEISCRITRVARSSVDRMLVIQHFLNHLLVILSQAI